jgi:hypothetical protein
MKILKEQRSIFAHTLSFIRLGISNQCVNRQNAKERLFTHGTPPPVVYSSSDGAFDAVSSCKSGPLNKSNVKSSARLTLPLRASAYTEAAERKGKATSTTENNIARYEEQRCKITHRAVIGTCRLYYNGPGPMRKGFCSLNFLMEAASGTVKSLFAVI